jgi:hypothetical protein
MFNLSHRELANAKKTSAWGDLITERAPNLCRGEWHPAIIEFEKPGEVYEMTLSSLRSKVPVMQWGRTTMSL